jgi:hypothetical protein
MLRFKPYLLLGVFFLAIGCKAKYGASEYAKALSTSAGGVYYDRGLRDDADYYRSEQFAESPALEQEMLSQNDFERKIVMMAHVRVRVENLDEADSLITAMMKKYGAYASSSVIEDNTR